MADPLAVAPTQSGDDVNASKDGARTHVEVVVQDLNSLRLLPRLKYRDGVAIVVLELLVRRFLQRRTKISSAPMSVHTAQRTTSSVKLFSGPRIEALCLRQKYSESSHTCTQQNAKDQLAPEPSDASPASQSSTPS